MTAKTTDFSGLLYYNPVTNGFNPVQQATINCADSMNEYDSISVNVVTWDIADGTNLYWRVVPYGTNLTLGRFTLGSSDVVSVNNNRAIFSIAVSADNTTSPDQQSFDIIVSKTLNGPALVTKTGIIVNDTSQTTTYTLTPEANNVNEGSGLTFVASGTNVPDGGYYWTIETHSEDFTTTSGSLGISNNYGSFIVVPTADATTEGLESFTVALRSGSISGPILATSGADINDTSQTPTYALATAGSVTSVNEGTALTFNVTTTNVANGTTLYWNLGSTGSYALVIGRFSAVSGSVTINGNSGSFAVTVSADSTTATGTQSYNIQLSTTTPSPTFVGSAVSVTVNDTSQTPVLGLSVNWYGTTSLIVPTGSYTTPQAGAVTLPSGSYVNVGQNLQSTTFTVTVDANLNSAGSPWVVLWGNDSYTAQTGYVMYWNSTTNGGLGIWTGRFLNSTTPNINSAGRRVYTSVVNGLNVAFYVNGTLINSGTLTGSATTIPNNNFLIGARHSNSGTLLPANNLDAKGGTYYSAKVQGTALTAAQVVNEYALMPGAKSFSGTQSSANSGSSAVHIDTNATNDAWCSTVPVGTTIAVAGYGTYTVVGVLTPTTPGNSSNNWYFSVTPNNTNIAGGTNMTFTWTV